MRVLGIDPGSRFLGYGVVELRQNKSTHVVSGVVRADGKSPLHSRLATIYAELKAVIDVYRPEAVAVEGVFTHKNARSALILGHARGVALLLAAQAGLDVHEYAPARVKKSVGAGGNDSKDAVARMVERLLLLPEPLERSDAYDALAVALCHVHQFRAPRATSSRTVPLKFGASERRSGSEDFLARLRPAVVRAVP
jgi:crossover junction endodeoxyribonuclease RuvC